MQRANDNSNQSIDQMRQTVQTLALRVNQLERMLDGKELREAKVEDGTVYQRGTRLSLSNGMIAPGWNPAELNDSVGESFPWDKVSFGYKINPDGDNPAKVRIYKGTIFMDNYYTAGPYYFNRNIDTTDFVLTTQAYAKIAITSLSESSFDAALSINSGWPSFGVFLLYNFACNDGVVTLTQVHHIGDFRFLYSPALTKIASDLGL